MFIHLFDVDTVSAEAGVTELAIVARLHRTSTFVTALHLQFRIRSNKPDQTDP